MEYEVRYYFSTEKLNDIISKLKNIKELQMNERSYEKTTQFDHPDDKNSFYSKEIDGRFRIRVTKNEIENKCKMAYIRKHMEQNFFVL